MADGVDAAEVGHGVGEAVDEEAVAVFAGGDEAVVEHAQCLVLGPGEVGLAAALFGQAAEEGDHVVFVGVGGVDVVEQFGWQRGPGGG